MNARMFNGNNLPRELLLTQRQTTKLRDPIENNLKSDINLSEAQISKIIQSCGFLGKILGPLLKTGLPLLKSVTWIIGYNSCNLSIRCWCSKKDTWFWNNNFSNFN